MLWPLFLLCLTGCSALQVNIPGLGTVEGGNETTYFTNRTFFKFRGIPYAEPIRKEERFMRPVKKAPWGDVLDATEYGEMCLQVTNGHTNGSEDCLFLDVYSPQVSSTSKFPVLFYIHGGSYIEGTSRNVKPLFLLEHDVVLVTAQYRLGPLGFLTLKTSNKTGSAGLYDVLLALQWVHDNILNFGGDPEKITVAGNSAGAGLACLLYVSPLTQDIIHQVMLFSGSALSLWALDEDPITSSHEIAREVGCSNTIDDDMLLCLQNMTNPIQLTEAYNKLYAQAVAAGRGSMGGVTPSIDGEIIVESPEKTLVNSTFKGRPMFLSVNKNEGIFLADILFQNDQLQASEVPKNHIVNILMGITGIHDPSYTVAAAVSEIYFPSEDMTSGVIDFSGTAYFKAPGLKTVKLNGHRNGSSYLITFSYDPHGTGVDHMVEQHYLFARNISGFAEEDYKMAEKFTKICANFIMKGSPNDDSGKVYGVEWHPYSREQQTYLVFDSSIQLKTGFEQEFTITRREKEEKANSATTYRLFVLLLILPALLAI